jgi:G protein-coupled receptor kinase interacting protein 2
VCGPFDSIGRFEVIRSAKRKLQMLPNYLFEEVAIDVYDEIDRRETEN